MWVGENLMLKKTWAVKDVKTSWSTGGAMLLQCDFVKRFWIKMMNMVQECRSVFFKVQSSPNLRRRWMVQSRDQSKVQQGTRKEMCDAWVICENRICFAGGNSSQVQKSSFRWLESRMVFMFPRYHEAVCIYDCIVGLEISSAEVKLQQSSGNLKKSVSLAG